jgi:hypothetical protein
MAKEIYHLLQINKIEQLEYCKATLKRTEIQIDAIISRLEENLEKQDNAQNNMKATI